MKATRPVTKPPPAVARTAPGTAREVLPACPSKFSRHDFTPHQRFAPLAPRQPLRADYRGPGAMLREWAESRDASGPAKVPDHSTMQEAAERLLVRGGSTPSCRRPSARRGAAA